MLKRNAIIWVQSLDNCKIDLAQKYVQMYSLVMVNDIFYYIDDNDDNYINGIVKIYYRKFQK